MNQTRGWAVGAILSASLLACGIQYASGDQDTAPTTTVSTPAAKSEFNIVDFGAVGDGKTMNTPAIQKALDSCGDAGGGRVVVPAGTFLTGPIELRNNMDFHLDRGAMILFSANKADYPLIDESFEGKEAIICQSPLSGKDLDNLRITGEGTIEGQGQVWRPVAKARIPDKDWDELVKSGGVVTKSKDEETQQKDKTWYPSQAALDGREKLAALRRDPAKPKMEDYVALKDLLRPPLVTLENCTHLTLERATFQNAPNWTIHLLSCKNVQIRNIVIFNPPWARNADGLDIDSCSGVTITGCTINTGDDDICLKSGRDEEGRKRNQPTENVTVSDCTIGWGHGGIALGSETAGSIRNVTVTNCTMKGTRYGLRFKSVRGRGGVVENIQISNITMSDISLDAIVMDMYYETRDTKPQPVNEGTPIFRNISIRNVTCRGAKYAIEVHGLPEMPMSNILLENVNLTTDIGAIIENASNFTLRGVEIHSKVAPPLEIRNVSGLTTQQVMAIATGPLPKPPAALPTTQPATPPN